MKLFTEYMTSDYPMIFTCKLQSKKIIGKNQQNLYIRHVIFPHRFYAAYTFQNGNE